MDYYEKYPEVTLNGTDWSNMYLVDYPGGTGGEMFTSLISQLVDVKDFELKTEVLVSNVVDSCGNGYATFTFPDFIKNSLNVYGYQDVVNDINVVQEVLKVLIYYWQFENRNKDLYNEALTVKSKTIPKQFREKAFNKKITDNMVIRTHFNASRYEDIPGAHVLRLHPKNASNARMSIARMLMLKWLTLDWMPRSSEIPNDYLREKALEKDGRAFVWEQENALKYEGKHSFSTFTKMVLKSAEPYDTINSKVNYDHVINSHDWLFNGLSDEDKRRFERIVGVEYSEPDNVKEWRLRNVNFMNESGFDINKDYTSDEIAIIALKKYKKLCTQLKL